MWIHPSAPSASSSLFACSSLLKLPISASKVATRSSKLASIATSSQAIATKRDIIRDILRLLLHRLGKFTVYVYIYITTRLKMGKCRWSPPIAMFIYFLLRCLMVSWRGSLDLEGCLEVSKAGIRGWSRMAPLCLWVKNGVQMPPSHVGSKCPLIFFRPGKCCIRCCGS